jgi:anti-anti-sigma factor
MADDAVHELSVAIDRSGDDTVVSLTGDIDLASVGRLRDVLMDLVRDAQNDVVVDLDGTSYIDSVGIGMLVSAHKRFEAAGRQLTFARPSRPVSRLFDIMGLRNFLHVDG